MSRKPFTVTRAEARELKRIDQKMSREGGTPHEAVRKEWLADMAAELRKLAKTFERTGRGARELLEALVIAETEGVDAALLEEIRREIGQKVRKRRAA
jgi:hypothetical protein